MSVYLLMCVLEFEKFISISIFSSYHFDNVNMLIFVSHNIIIGSHCVVIGRAMELSPFLSAVTLS